MNETPTTPVAPVESQDTAQAFDMLQRQFQTVLLILILLVAVLDCYMWRQWHLLKSEANGIEPQVMQLTADFQRVTVPLVRNFLGQLNEYAKTHPDFQPIMAKYNIQPIPSNAAPTAAQPAKAAPPAARAPTPAPAKPVTPAATPKK
jgi:hypothetical protein